MTKIILQNVDLFFTIYTLFSIELILNARVAFVIYYYYVPGKFGLRFMKGIDLIILLLLIMYVK